MEKKARNKEKGKHSRPGVDQLLTLLGWVIIMQAPPAIVKRRPSKELFMNGSNNRSAIIEGSPETRVGNLVVEGGLEGGKGAVSGVEDDLLAELGYETFFGNGELYARLGWFLLEVI